MLRWMWVGSADLFSMVPVIDRCCRQLRAHTIMNENSFATENYFSIGLPELILILLLPVLLVLFGVLPFWFICKKAGFSPWLSLLMLIPFGNLLLPFLIAFMNWPALERSKL